MFVCSGQCPADKQFMGRLRPEFNFGKESAFQNVFHYMSGMVEDSDEIVKNSRSSRVNILLIYREEVRPLKSFTR